MSNLHNRLQSQLQSLSNRIANSANRLSDFSPMIAAEYQSTFSDLLMTIDSTVAMETSLKCQYLMSVLGLNTEQKYTPHKALFQFMEYFDVTELKTAGVSHDDVSWTLDNDCVSKKKIRHIVAGSEFSYEKVFSFSKWRDRYSIQGQYWTIKEPFSPNVYTSTLTYTDEEERNLFDKYLARIVGMPELYLERTTDEVVEELTTLVVKKFLDKQPTLLMYGCEKTSEINGDMALYESHRSYSRLFDLLNNDAVSDPPLTTDVNHHFYEAGAREASAICIQLSGMDDVKIVALECGKRFDVMDDWLYLALYADGTCKVLKDSKTFSDDGKLYKRSTFSIDHVIQKLKKIP